MADENKAILYGVQRVELEELDKATQMPFVDGIKIIVDTAETVSSEAVLSEGEENVKRNDVRIMAIARTDDLLYGYTLTMTDNTFDPSVASLIGGGIASGSGDTFSYRTAMLNEGSTLKPFRMTYYCANYEGDSIKNYFKIVYNNCTGVAPGMNNAREFYSPEYSVKAREATKAGLPIMSMSIADSLPADAAPVVVSTSIGTLNTVTKSITAIPSSTTVSAFKAALTISLGAVASVISSAGDPVTSGNVTTGQKLVVSQSINPNNKTEYTLTVTV